MTPSLTVLLGIKYFGGGPFERVPFRWYHLCALISYTDEGAEREFYVDGKLNFQATTKYLPDTKWPKGHNLTIGGREISYSGVHFHGLVTDVQLFSRKLSKEEAVAYTTCSRVKQLNDPDKMLISYIFSGTERRHW